MLDSFDSGRYRTKDATICMVTNAEIRRLGKEYADDGRVTDVLSFRMGEDVPEGCDEDIDKGSVSWGALFNPSASPSHMLHKDLDVNQVMVPNEMGSVYLALNYCERVAARRGIDTQYYILMATVHGLAHLAGHDHANPEEYSRMKNVEEKALNLINPYSYPKSYLP